MNRSQRSTQPFCSTVLLEDGQGMVIGGLIREIDDDQRIKAAGLVEL